MSRKIMHVDLGDKEPTQDELDGIVKAVETYEVSAWQRWRLRDFFRTATFRVRETLSFWLLDLAFWICGSHKSPPVMRALDEYKRVKSEPEREVMDLLKVHFMHGHSGGSHFATLSLFNHLANGKTLSPLTDDPNEWMDISQYQSGEPGWQNLRNSACFSKDGGKTYTNLEDGETHTDEDGFTYKTYKNLPVHTSVDHTKRGQ